MKRIFLATAAIFGLMILTTCTATKAARVDDGTEFMTAK